MKRISMLAGLVTALFVGCAEEKKKEQEGLNLEFPGGSVRVGEDGVDVQAPGVDVKVDDKRVDVNAPNVGVQAERGKGVGVQAPGVDVDVKQGTSKGK